MADQSSFQTPTSEKVAHAKINIPDTETLSKKDKRWLERHEAELKRRPERRAKEKEQKKVKRQIARDNGVIPTKMPRKACKHNKMIDSECRIRVAVDCSFDEFMNFRDIIKLDKQLSRCYSENRRVPNPLQYYVCDINGKLKERLESIGDYHYWDVHKTDESYMDTFNKEHIVFLTGDSDNVLTDLTEDKVYIIGGLIDHNHHKGICFERAVEKGIAHARLPLSEYVCMKTRSVLAITHVFEILLHYTTHKDWKKAFLSVIPQRKGAKDLASQSTEALNSTNGDNTESIPETKSTEISNSTNNDGVDSISGRETKSTKTSNSTNDDSVDSISAKETKSTETSNSTNNDGVDSISGKETKTTETSNSTNNDGVDSISATETKYTETSNITLEAECEISAVPSVSKCDNDQDNICDEDEPADILNNVKQHPS